MLYDDESPCLSHLSVIPTISFSREADLSMYGTALVCSVLMLTPTLPLEHRTLLVTETCTHANMIGTLGRYT